MHRLGKAPFLTIWFYVIIGCFVTWQESFTPISSEDYSHLVTYRIFILVTAIPFAYRLRKNPFSVLANSFICFNFLAYSMVGHIFRPLYITCFLQTLFAFSFLFFTSRRLYFLLTTAKSIIFAAFYLWSYDLVLYRHGAETKEDFLATILVGWALSLLMHHLFTAERGLKEAANERFSLLGRHAANIIHDVKGTLSVPYLYVTEAQRALEAGQIQTLTEQLAGAEASLKQSEKIIHDLNQLSRFANKGEVPFKVAEALKDVLRILTKRLHDVELRIEGDFELVGDRGLFSSILLNLIVNSLESIKKAETEWPKIEIIMNPIDKTISIQDNGTGFSEKALSALKSGLPITDDYSASGLGLYLVKENLRILQGAISFSNHSKGATTQIRF